MSRKCFMERTALAAGGLMLGGLTYGIFRGAYSYKVHKVALGFPNLPESFDGFRIVQISDLHLGSFRNDDPLWHARDIICSLYPDLLLFTGDLVNNHAWEAFGFHKVLGALHAPFGVYSILGNHDYGDYVRWKSKDEKEKNLMELVNFQKDMGWNLLRNENAVLRKGNDVLAILGVENWSKHLRFIKYGNMESTLRGAEEIPFKILMSHDPSHWEGEILEKYSGILLTLSGHTHGFQFGVELPGWKWSPVQYVYKQWAGLYHQEKQFLYVNRGLGFIGYPGRLGIWPEITLLELYRSGQLS